MKLFKTVLMDHKWQVLHDRCKAMDNKGQHKRLWPIQVRLRFKRGCATKQGQYPGRATIQAGPPSKQARPNSKEATPSISTNRLWADAPQALIDSVNKAEVRRAQHHREATIIGHAP